MRQIKLSGRERAVLRAMDFSNATLGQDLLEVTRLDPEDLLDVLNGLMSLGYAESVPYHEVASLEALPALHFEINASYCFDLRAAIARS